MAAETRQTFRLKTHQVRRLDALAAAQGIPKTHFISVLFDLLTDADFTEILRGAGAPETTQKAPGAAVFNIDAEVNLALKKALADQLPAAARGIATQLEITAAAKILNAISKELEKTIDNNFK